jgi:non-heme chloroperoxidase
VGALTTLLDLSRIVLVGTGLGAAVAVAYATLFPRTLAGLVLVGALAPRWTRARGFPQGIPRQDVERLLEESETNWPDLLRRFVGSLFHTEVGEPTRSWFQHLGFEASLYMVQQCLLLLRDADLRSELAGIRVPTAVFHGSHDVVSPPAIGEYLAAHIPDAALVRFDQSGHAVWIDEKFRFNTELTGFIEQRVFGNVLPPPGTERTPGGGERLPFEEIATRPRRGPPRIEGATGRIYE